MAGTGFLNTQKAMNKQNLFEKEPMTVKGVSTIEDMYAGENSNPNGSTSDGQPWLNSLFENLGDIAQGAASIVSAANTKNYNTKNENINTNTNKFSWTNGTTITAMVIGGVAIIIVLILVLRKKD